MSEVSNKIFGACNEFEVVLIEISDKNGNDFAIILIFYKISDKFQIELFYCV